jgi:GT2 family glycosyltransferase
MSSMDVAPLIGVVTVLYRSDTVLPDFFRSLAGQTNVQFKLYVIDNTENDSGCAISRELAARYRISINIVFNNENVGVARGNNQGIEAALADGCEYVLLANNDVDFPDPEVIAGLVQHSVEAAALAAVPKITYYGTNKIWCAGGRFSRFRAITPHAGYQREDQGQFDVQKFTEYAPTCFMLLNRRVFDEVGLMDEKYFVYYDDSDFVWRMNNAGIRLLYVPTSRVAHKVSVSTGGIESPFGLYYTSRNRVYFSRKNLPVVLRTIAIAYSIAWLAFKCMRFPPAARSSVFKGLKAGFVLPIS